MISVGLKGSDKQQHHNNGRKVDALVVQQFHASENCVDMHFLVFVIQVTVSNQHSGKTTYTSIISHVYFDVLISQAANYFLKTTNQIILSAMTIKVWSRNNCWTIFWYSGILSFDGLCHATIIRLGRALVRLWYMHIGCDLIDECSFLWDEILKFQVWYLYHSNNEHYSLLFS